MFIANEVNERYDGPGERIPECLKAFPSGTTTEDDEEFSTLKKIDEELKKLLKKH